MPNFPKQLKPSLFKPDAVNPGTESAFVPPTATPFGQDEVNPFKTGLQLGAVGAAAGVGIAGIQRALRLRAGNTTPVSVYKPMAIGAMIGAALGGIGGYKQHQYVDTHQPYPQPQSWDELSGRLEAGSELNKYGGLMRIVKRAQAADIAKEVGKTGLYFVPGVGTVMTAGDALHGYGSGLANLFKGNFRGAASGIGSGVGNTALALASLFTGGSNILGGAAKGIKGIANINRLGKAGLGTAEAVRAGRLAGGRLGGLWRRMAPAAERYVQGPAGAAGGTLSKLEAGGRVISPYAKYQNKLMWGGIGTTVGSGLMGEAPAAGQPVAPRSSPRYTPANPGVEMRPMRAARIPDQDMPQMEVPSVQF